jgi:hypothetical protein
VELLLLGHVKNDDDAWPISLSTGKVINSRKIEKYVNRELIAYFEFYRKCKRFGLPWGLAWNELPAWVTDLIMAFERIENHFESKRKSDTLNNVLRFIASCHGRKVTG